MPGSLRRRAGKTVVVTGAGGFLGGRLVDRLADGRLPRSFASRRSALPPLDQPSAARVTDVIGDVSDRAVWDASPTRDVIFHFAAQTSAAVAAGESGSRISRSNVTPMRHLLAACRQSGRRPVVLFAGTVTEAGIPSRLPVNEDAPDDPITIYDRHKLMAEGELKAAVLRGRRVAEPRCGSPMSTGPARTAARTIATC